MKAQFIFENINFERGKNAKSAMSLGYSRFDELLLDGGNHNWFLELPDHTKEIIMGPFEGDPIYWLGWGSGPQLEQDRIDTLFVWIHNKSGELIVNENYDNIEDARGNSDGDIQVCIKDHPEFGEIISIEWFVGNGQDVHFFTNFAGIKYVAKNIEEFKKNNHR